MNKEQVTAVMDDLKVKQDLYRLHKLEKEYNDLSDKCNKLYKFIYSLDFVDKVRNVDERILLREHHKRMEAYRTNLYQLIQFYRNLIAVNKGYDIFTPWCEVAEKIEQEAVESTTHHCGQDAPHFDPNESQPVDLDDACCQAKNNASCPVGGGYAAVNEAQVPNSIKSLVGMQIVSVFPLGWKCQGCAYDSDYFRCEKKVELVGGYMLCLAQIPIVTE